MISFISPVQSQAAVPGDACATAGVFQNNGGPELSGAGHMMVCQGGTWKSILSFNANGQITRASNSTCTNGQVLKFDSTKFDCGVDAGITTETDPQVGTLTNCKWCASNAGGTAIGGFSTTSYYWSSTETNSTNAWTQYFGHGGSANIGKTGSYAVRCVRGI